MYGDWTFQKHSSALIFVSLLIAIWFSPLSLLFLCHGESSQPVLPGTTKDQHRK